MIQTSKLAKTKLQSIFCLYQWWSVVQLCWHKFDEEDVRKSYEKGLPKLKEEKVRNTLRDPGP
jgi:hypothetical protein